MGIGRVLFRVGWKFVTVTRTHCAAKEAFSICRKESFILGYGFYRVRGIVRVILEWGGIS